MIDLSVVLDRNSTSVSNSKPSIPATQHAGTARISREALGANMRSAAYQHSSTLWLDVSCNAFGFGLREVVAIAVSEGIRGFYVSCYDEWVDARLTCRNLWNGCTVVIGAPEVARDTTSAGERSKLDTADDLHFRDFCYGVANDARSTLRLDGNVLAAKFVRAGDGISYGHVFRAPNAGFIAQIGIGYGHGIGRKSGNRAQVSIGGRRFPVVGKVSMDTIFVWVGSNPITVGTTVSVIGHSADGGPTLAEWAIWTEARPLEIISSLDERILRSYV